MTSSSLFQPIVCSESQGQKTQPENKGLQLQITEGRAALALSKCVYSCWVFASSCKRAVFTPSLIKLPRVCISTISAHQLASQLPCLRPRAPGGGASPHAQHAALGLFRVSAPP